MIRSGAGVLQERAFRNRLSKTKAKKTAACLLCDQRIRPGMWIGFCYAVQDWTHLGCLIRRINGVEVTCEA
jgi:hypothetical protein